MKRCSMLGLTFSLSLSDARLFVGERHIRHFFPFFLGVSCGFAFYSLFACLSFVFWVKARLGLKLRRPFQQSVTVTQHGSSEFSALSAHPPVSSSSRLSSPHSSPPLLHSSKAVLSRLSSARLDSAGLLGISSICRSFGNSKGAGRGSTSGNHVEEETKIAKVGDRHGRLWSFENRGI